MTAAVTRDQFAWEGETLVHKPTGAHFTATKGFADWGRKPDLWRNGDFDPIDIGFVAGQLLAERRNHTPPRSESHERE